MRLESHAQQSDYSARRRKVQWETLHILADWGDYTQIKKTCQVSKNLAGLFDELDNYCPPVFTVGTMPGPGSTIVGVVPSGTKIILSVWLSAAALARAISSVT